MTGKKLRVLFIGNSYTYYNDMPQAAFTELAKAAGFEVEVTAVTQGGYKLCWFADQPLEKMEISAKAQRTRRA